MLPSIEESAEEKAGKAYTMVSQAIHRGEHGIEMLAMHIPYALGHNPDQYVAWKRRVLPPEGKVVELEKFEDYLLFPPREGFGFPSLHFVDGALKLLGKKGIEALTCLRKAIPDWDDRIEREAGQRIEAMETKQGNNQHRKFSDTTQLSRAESNGISDRTQRKLDRLAKDRPDLLQRVKAKELSVHKAAIEAGFVKPPTRLEKAIKAYLLLDTGERDQFWDYIESEASTGATHHAV